MSSIEFNGVVSQYAGRQMVRDVVRRCRSACFGGSVGSIGIVKDCEIRPGGDQMAG